MKKKYLWTILAFILPLLSAFMVYAFMGFYPFGSKSIYISDLYAQYRGFLMYAKQIILGNESIEYSWNFFSGSNMMGNFAYYMGSLYNFILVFIPTEYFYTGIVVIIGLKLSSISVAMFTFLDNSFNNKKIVSLFLSLNFTFSGMIVGYFFNIIWLDTFIFLPLIINELLHVLKTKEIRNRYIILVFLMILANFYMAFMVTIFSILFVFAGFYNYRFSFKDMRNIFLKLIGFSLVALLMTGIIIVPTLFQLVEGVRNTIPTVEVNFSFPKLLAKMFNGVYFNRSFISNSKTVYPHIYSGMLPLIVLPLFFISKKVPKRERISFGLILFVLIISLIVPEIGNIWHAFTYPTGFPYRFSFIFSFLLIFLCAKGFECNVFEYKGIALSCMFWSAVLAYLLVVKEIGFSIWFWNQILLVCVVIFALFADMEKLNKPFAFLAILFVMIEVTVHQERILAKLDHVTPFTEYNSNTEEEAGEFSKYREQLEAKDKPFKKVVSTYGSFDTDNIYYDFPSISGFSSMVNKRYLLMLTKLGYSSSSVRVKRDGGTMVTDILLGNQYRIEPKDKNSSLRKQFQLAESEEQSNLIKTKYENPIGLLFGDEDVSLETPSDIQNRIIESFGGNPSDYLNYYRLSPTEEYGIKRENNEINQIGEAATFAFDIPEAKEDDLIYVYFPPRISNNVNYIVDTEKNQVTPGWHQLEPVKDKKILLTWEENQIFSDFDLYFMTIDRKKFTHLMLNQPNRGMKINSMTNTSFEGVLQVADKNNLVLPIPFDKGWTFAVNNHKITAEAGFGGLIMLPGLPKNQQITIRGEYRAPGFLLGIGASSLGVLGLVLISVLEAKKERTNRT